MTIEENLERIADALEQIVNRLPKPKSQTFPVGMMSAEEFSEHINRHIQLAEERLDAPQSDSHATVTRGEE